MSYWIAINIFFSQKTQNQSYIVDFYMVGNINSNSDDQDNLNVHILWNQMTTVAYITYVSFFKMDIVSREGIGW